ncbi:MAG: FeoA family protein [bacterium]
MPVTMCDVGQSVTVERITGTDAVRQHLSEMGFHAGSEVLVVSNNGGNLILSVKGVRVALDSKMANRLIVATKVFHESLDAGSRIQAREAKAAV